MSAISGIYQLNEEPVPIDQCRNLMNALQRYPADDVQIWRQNNIFLGCHAQWITPESVGELVPWYDHERQLAITADAIIDNRNQLLEILLVDPAHRKNTSDSELILLAYQKWGKDVPNFLIGDFAFMIWDEKRRLLFGARDFSGSRTLYYYHNKQRFAFCTIIRPLFSLPYIEERLNEQWLAEYLAIPGMLDAVDVSSTVYKNINQIPPSHTVEVTADKIIFSRYSTITIEEQLKLKSNRDYEEAFREVFQTAVTARLRTRKKVGVRLSGGLDSGCVASFAARALRQQKKQLYSFSYVPPDDFVDWTPKFRVANERPFIEATVEYVGNIRDQYLDFKEKSPLSEVDDMLEILEMPYKYFGNAFWLKGMYETANQQGMGVLLNGGRGNYTISWGPALEYYAILFKRLNWVRLYHELQLYSRNLGVKQSRVFGAVRKSAFPMIDRIFSSTKAKYQYPQLINSAFARKMCIQEKLNAHGIDMTGTPDSMPNSYEARLQRFEQLSHWNISGTSGTKLSLQYALWERDPTNDLRVIRFCLSVPDEQFVQNGFDRAFIRRSTEGLLPDKVRLNQSFRGVQGADAIHRMAPSWKQFVEELQQLCRDDRVSQYFNLKVISAAILKIQGKPRPEYIIDPDFKVLTRSLIVYRFLKGFAERR